jgi:nucleotide-binding universal stress UspA family protein
MIRRILLPVDCSEHSTHAAKYAEYLAQQHDAVIYALGVVDVPGIERSAATVGAGASQYGREMRERRLDEARTVLGEFLDKLKADVKIRGIKLKRIRDSGGSVEDVIVEQSRITDLVVVARQINFEFETRETPGDTLFEMLEITNRMTLVVPDEFRPIKRVVMAHDRTRTCARVLYMLMHLNPFPDAELLLVHADRDGKVNADDFAETLGYVQEHGFSAEVKIRNLKPSRAILEVAEERQADAIVLGAYDVGSVRRLLFGSTAQRILQRSKIPLLFGT